MPKGLNLFLCQKARVVMVIAFNSTNDDIIALDLRGRCSPEDYSRMVEVCKDAATKIFTYFRSTVKKYCQYADIKGN